MLGERLAELREQKALTLRDLEEASGVGADAINKIENGHRKPRPSTLRKLARALGVEVEDFFRDPALLGDRRVPRDPRIEVVGSVFVPVPEDEKQTVEFHIVRLFDGDEPILRAMRKASPDEEAKALRMLAKAGNS